MTTHQRKQTPTRCLHLLHGLISNDRKQAELAKPEVSIKQNVRIYRKLYQGVKDIWFADFPSGVFSCPSVATRERSDAWWSLRRSGHLGRVGGHCSLLGLHLSGLFYKHFNVSVLMNSACYYIWTSWETVRLWTSSVYGLTSFQIPEYINGFPIDHSRFLQVGILNLWAEEVNTFFKLF